MILLDTNKRNPGHDFRCRIQLVNKVEKTLSPFDRALYMLCLGLCWVTGSIALPPVLTDTYISMSTRICGL
jgi:hypothetical protein